MASQEALGSGEDVPHHDGGSEGVDDVFVVGMQEQAVVDVPWVLRGIPEKPITAPISKSCCIS